MKDDKSKSICTLKAVKIFIILFTTFLLGYGIAIFKVNYMPIKNANSQHHGKQAVLKSVYTDSLYVDYIIAEGDSGVDATVDIEGEIDLVFKAGVLINVIEK
jgi:hypothetical protein